MSDYAYDVFLSYHCKEPVLGWVREQFQPTLEEWLTQELARDAKIFLDATDIGTGDTWPVRLQHALQRSRVLVPVFSPTYFRRPWCVAELYSMRAREDLLGYRTAANPEGLIYPVRFHDGASFPSDAQAIQSRDMTRWNINSAGFRHTVDYADFIRAVQTFAAEVANRINTAPPWDASWPIVEPPPSAPTTPSMPRL